MGVKIDASEIEDADAAPAPPARVKIDAADIAEPVPQRNRAPSETASDEQLGLASGPITHNVTVGDRIGMAATPQEAAANRARRPADPMEADPLAQAVVSSVVAGGAGKLANAGAKAAGAGGTLARILGGSAAGGTAGGTTGNGVVEGAIAGAALEGLSPLMRFVGARAAMAKAGRVARETMRSGGDTVQALPLVDVVNTVKKYGIESVKTPQVADEALMAAISKATLVREEASKAMTNAASAGHPNGALARDAVAAFNEANKEVNILKALHPVVKKIAAAAQLKPTMMERVGAGAGKALKAAGAGAVGYGGWKAVKGVMGE